jgi:hypothetical protein
MEYTDYKDQDGRVWTRFSLELQDHHSMTSEDFRQVLLDQRAEKEGWAVFEQPDPYTEN